MSEKAILLATAVKIHIARSGGVLENFQGSTATHEAHERGLNSISIQEEYEFLTKLYAAIPEVAG